MPFSLDALDQRGGPGDDGGKRVGLGIIFPGRRLRRAAGEGFGDDQHAEHLLHNVHLRLGFIVEDRVGNADHILEPVVRLDAVSIRLDEFHERDHGR